MSMAPERKGSFLFVFIAVAVMDYCIGINFVMAGHVDIMQFAQMGISFKTLMYVIFPIMAVIDTLLLCIIPCHVMLKAQDERSLRKRVLISAAIVLIFSLFSSLLQYYSKLTAIISSIIVTYLCVIFPYLYLFHSAVSENPDQVRQSRFRMALLVIFIINLALSLFTLFSTEGFQFETGFIPAWIASVVGGICQGFLLPYSAVVFSENYNKKKILIGSALIVALLAFSTVFILSGSVDWGILSAFINSIIYFVLPCFYIFGWLGGKGRV